MSNEKRFKDAAKIISEHDETHKAPGWDRRIEIAILDVFGNGNTKKGREALFLLAEQRLQKI